jgi:PAS domain S-box-containing protein
MRGTHNFYKVLLDKLYEGVYICNNDLQITYWNSTAEKITGYKQEDVLGKYWWDLSLLHYDMQGNALTQPDSNPMVKSFKNEIFVEGEVYFKHKKGHLMLLNVQVSPIKDEKEHITGAIETVILLVDGVEKNLL